MARDLTPVARLLHHAAWLFYLQNTTASHRDAINAHVYRPDPNVPVNEPFLSGDHEEFEAFLGTFRALGLIETRAYGSDMLEHRFTAQAATLAEALAAMDTSEVDADAAFVLLLRVAEDFHLSFESMKDGRFAVAEFPIGQGAFAMPEIHAGPVEALAALGLMEREGGACRWSDAARPHFEALGLWVGTETRDTLYHDRLRRIWDAMPERLRAASVTPSGEISVLNLAGVLGQFLEDNQWNRAPFSEALDLRGGTIPVAKDMWRLQEAGGLG